MGYTFNKIKCLVDEGMSDTYLDGYYMLVDMGEVKESDYMKRKCQYADEKIRDKKDGIHGIG